MSSLDLIAIGDVSMDVFMTPTESEALCRTDNHECFICFSYGEKIPVKTIDYCIGGNAANNSVGARRLGINSGIVTTLGGDSVGNQIVEKLESENVNMDFTVQQPEAGSNYSTIINYSGERTIFTYHAPRSYEFPVQLPAVPWIYLTSMGESFAPFYKHFADFMHENPTVKMAFNPGSRQLRSGVDQLKSILEVTHLLYVNRQEAEKLTGLTETHNKEKDLLTASVGLGPKIIIITDGGNGSFVYDSIANKFYRCGVLPVDAYERTGAGDAFGSGCVSALIKGKSFEEALLWGTVNSASVIGYTGSQRGLLSEAEMGEWLEKARSCGVRAEEF